MLPAGLEARKPSRWRRRTRSAFSLERVSSAVTSSRRVRRLSESLAESSMNTAQCTSGSRLRCMVVMRAATSWRLASAVILCFMSLVLPRSILLLLVALWRMAFSSVGVTWRV